MAIYHLSVKTHTRCATKENKGSVMAVVAYRSCQKLGDDQGQEFDFSKKKDSVYNGLVFSPEFAEAFNYSDTSTIEQFWKNEDRKEKKSNSATTREIIFALPNELTPEQNKKLTETFCKKVVGIHRCAGSFHIHRGKPKPNVKTNGHVHFLMTTRNADGQKMRQFNDKKDSIAAMEEIRLLWETTCNQALEAAGSSARIDRRSNADRLIETPPSVHIGPSGLSPDELERRQKAVKEKHERDLLRNKAIKEEKIDGVEELNVTIKELTDRTGTLTEVFKDTVEKVSAVKDELFRYGFTLGKTKEELKTVTDKKKKVEQEKIQSTTELQEIRESIDVAKNEQLSIQKDTDRFGHLLALEAKEKREAKERADKEKAELEARQRANAPAKAPEPKTEPEPEPTRSWLPKFGR